MEKEFKLSIFQNCNQFLKQFVQVVVIWKVFQGFYKELSKSVN